MRPSVTIKMKAFRKKVQMRDTNAVCRRLKSHAQVALMVEILKDNARPEAGEICGAMDMAWAKLVGQIAQAYGK